MGLFTKITDAANKGVSAVTPYLPSKALLIKQATSINYEELLKKINDHKDKIPDIQNLNSSIQLMSEASIVYNQSESETKDDEFVDYINKNIDIQMVLKDLEPFVNILPGGNYVVLLFRFVLYLKK